MALSFGQKDWVFPIIPNPIPIIFPSSIKLQWLRLRHEVSNAQSVNVSAIAAHHIFHVSAIHSHPGNPGPPPIPGRSALVQFANGLGIAPQQPWRSQPDTRTSRARCHGAFIGRWRGPKLRTGAGSRTRSRTCTYFFKVCYYNITLVYRTVITIDHSRSF